MDVADIALHMADSYLSRSGVWASSNVVSMAKNALDKWQDLISSNGFVLPCRTVSNSEEPFMQNLGCC